MKTQRCGDILAGALVLCLLSGAGARGAAASYGLGWIGPTTILADENGVARARYTSRIRVGSSPSPGNLGWSFALLGENVRIANATISGTTVEPHLEGASVEIERLDSSVGNGYRVSVLFPEPRNLLPVGFDSMDILQVDVELESLFPRSFGKLRYGDTEGVDDPLRPRVIEVGREVRPFTNDIGFTALHPSVCGDVVLGFSAESLDSDLPFEGVLGGAEGSGKVVFTSGRAPVTAHADLVTLLHPDLFFPVWGWTLSVVLEGDAQPVAISFRETPASRYFMSGFERTSIVDPAENGGRKGFTSGVLLTISQPSTYPHLGSRSILKMDLVPTSLPGNARLRFEDGLRELGGLPVTNQVLIQGSNVFPCNREIALLEMNFSAEKIRFRRGDANGDGRINVSDAISILSALIENADDSCLASRDVNADRKIELTDAIHLLAYLFQSGAAPEEPYGTCGPGPADGLGCLIEPQACR